ncbi:MAG: undecaprenyl/decaprenyl-phosphate alpha-N-acetylglucosaminyl 1-phosphate transferase [Bacteroidales bacterium]|jgi:UDP-N-acetylmuramyl pentapeptide phosphotransferase/UDP-N-acetylglucosamine-1-phosphate transferase|nr:undecaprenyl/decaprenyl-phosphate alpha-N-acetylglucosaminyl 1-phosphate transferase [Bacteroidales bacterium]
MENFTWIALLKVALAGLTSGIIALRLIPSINRIARSKGLLNIPGERTSHRHKTPNLAGISIFIAFCCSSLFFITDLFETFRVVFLASIIIFFVGLKDDIVAISPGKKLIAEITAAVLVAAVGNIRFIHTYNFLGIENLNDVTSIIITVVVIITIVNAVNLIDGIDGLAAAIGVLILGVFGMFFFVNGMFSRSVYCASMIGALVAFFQYNVFGLRNKTFMGDSGSLLLGLTIAVVTIRFWETNAEPNLFLTFSYAPAIAFAVLIIPIFDVIRVFLYRIIRGSSPFMADRNHLHHRLIDVGFSHLQATGILFALNMLMIGIAFGLSLFFGMIWIVLTLLVLMILFTYCINKFIINGKKLENQ